MEDNHESEPQQASEGNQFPHAIYDEEALIQKLGRKWRRNIKNLLGLLAVVMCRQRADGEQSEFPLSCCSRALVGRFGNARNGSNVIRLAVAVGLLDCTDDFYSYNSGLAKEYRLNARMCDVLEAMGKKHGIRPKWLTNFRRARNTLEVCKKPSSNNEFKQNSSQQQSSTSPHPLSPPLNGGSIQRESVMWQGKDGSRNGHAASSPDYYNAIILSDGSVFGGRPKPQKTHKKNSTPPPHCFSNSRIYKSIKFSSKIRVSCAVQYIEFFLNRKYPFLEVYQRLADELNHDYHQDAPAEIIEYKPNYRTSKTGIITSISIRATSQACSYKSREKAAKSGSSKPYCGIYREDYLEELFGQPYGELAHYDICSSIYRVSYALQTGVWLPSSVDLYDLMYLGINPQSPAAQSYVPPFKTSKARQDFKGFAMRLYFGGCPAQIYSRCRDAFEGMNKKAALEVLRIAKEKMGVAIAGGFLDNEVFSHESNLMMRLRESLYKLGIKTSQCYDSLWSDDARLPALCEEMLPQVLERYLAELGRR